MSEFDEGTTGDAESFDMDAGVADIAESMGFGTSENDDEGIDDGDVETKEGETEKADRESNEEANQTESVKQPPASWAKDQRDHWAKIPKEAQEYVELREKQMLDGIEQYKQGHQMAAEMQRVLDPFRESIQKHGVTETQAIQNLFGHHIALTEGTLENRQNAFIALGQNLGIIPQEGQAQIDPRTRELQQRLDRIEQQEQQRTQQAQQQNYSKVVQDVESFAADQKNEYFDEVADDIVILLKTGLDLQSAYEKAVWANPITRAKELSKSVAEQTKTITAKQKEEALKARKATSTNIRPMNSSKESNQPTGDLFSSMAEDFAEIKRRG